MKLSEKIKECDEVSDLIRRRAGAVHKLRALEDLDDIRVGIDYDVVSFAKGSTVFDAVRAALKISIHEANDVLRARGIEIDLADDDSGYDLEGEDEDADEEEEEAA